MSAIVTPPSGVISGCYLHPLSCPGQIVKGVAGAATSSLADQVRQGLTEIVTSMLTWWVKSPNIVSGQTTPIEAMQHLLLPVTIAVAVAAVMWQGVMMMVRRKPDPLFDVGRGIFALGFYSAAGVALLVGVMSLADQLSSYLIDASTQGQFSARLTAVLTTSSIGDGLMIVLGVIVIIATLIQWVLLFFRQAGIVILAAFLPLAAAGSIGTGTKPWLRKLLSWILSLVFYKVMVAFCYAIAFELIGTSTDVAGFILGFVVLIIAIVALPVLLKLFSWGVDAGAEHLGRGVGGLVTGGAGLAMAGAQVANGFGGSGRVSAAQQASVIDQGLGSMSESGSGGGSGSSSPGAPGGSGPAGVGANGSDGGVGAGPSGAGDATEVAASSSGAAAGAGGSAVSSAGGAAGGAVGAGAAAPLIAAAQVGVDAVKGAANAAGEAMGGSGAPGGPSGAAPATTNEGAQL